VVAVRAVSILTVVHNGVTPPRMRHRGLLPPRARGISPNGSGCPRTHLDVVPAHV